MLARWENHCDNCTYLGAYKKYDLYVCAKGKRHSGRTEVVARYGEDGQYHSRETANVDQFAAEANFATYAVPLMVALARYRLAKKKKGPWKKAVASLNEETGTRA